MLVRIANKIHWITKINEAMEGFYSRRLREDLEIESQFQNYILNGYSSLEWWNVSVTKSIKWLFKKPTMREWFSTVYYYSWKRYPSDSGRAGITLLNTMLTMINSEEIDKFYMTPTDINTIECGISLKQKV